MIHLNNENIITKEEEVQQEQEIILSIYIEKEVLGVAYYKPEEATVYIGSMHVNNQDLLYSVSYVKSHTNSSVILLSSSTNEEVLIKNITYVLYYFIIHFYPRLLIL